MDMIICSNCGGEMPRFETVNGVGKDWSNEINPLCQVCRHVPGATPYHRKRDVLGGFPWKRDPTTGKKVPK